MAAWVMVLLTGGLRPYGLSGGGLRSAIALSASRSSADPLISTLTPAAPVAELLREVEATGERGIDADALARERIDSLVRACEAAYARDPVEDDASHLFHICDVAYVGQTSSRESNAAGGRFRGAFGRRVFRTRSLRQDLLQEGKAGAITAVNHLTFRLCGLISGDVVLCGRVTREPLAERERLSAAWNRTLGPGTVRAEFGPPRVRLGPLCLEIGPTSAVRLDVTYVDDTLRLSRGGRSGAAFIFRRVGAGAADAEGAEALEAAARAEWRAVLSRRPLSARTLGGALVCAGAVAAVAPALPTLTVGLPLALCGGWLMRSRGGIVPDEPGAVA